MSDAQAPTPAVQYLRMSSDEQRYSISAQSHAIARYAASHDYRVIRSYEDAGRSGLHLKGRDGLQRLLSDALSPERDFEAILVLDVSRWGRFQDLDQGAHYEFVCRSAGVQIVYCDEAFDADLGPKSALIKQLKRLMAAEYSRELSVKVSRAKRLQASLGRRQGGSMIYGFRRVLVDERGRRIATLDHGERKAQRAHTIRIEPGPEAELEVLRWLFRRYLEPEQTVRSVACELQRRGVPFIGERSWTAQHVGVLLRHELMIGSYVYRRTTETLGSPRRPVAPDEWVRVQVCAPVIAEEIFRRVQAKLPHQKRPHLSERAMLGQLSRALAAHGHLSAEGIKRSRIAPSVGAVSKRFGSLQRVYEALGYEPPPRKAPPEPFDSDRALTALREAYARHGHLTRMIVAADPSLFNPATYRKRFGSLQRAYELAGLPHSHGELVVAGRVRGRAAPRPAQDD